MMVESEENRIFEQKLLCHCAPTLLGRKPASLFACGRDLDEEQLEAALKSCREKIAPFDLRIKVMSEQRNGMLLYVYHRDALQRLLQAPQVGEFLSGLGYDPRSHEECLDHLSRRIKSSQRERASEDACWGSFPHEIGLLLGYPFSDVMAFIENKGANSLSCGCWKVYSNKQQAQQTFCTYKTCSEYCLKKLEAGVSLEEIIKCGTSENLEELLYAS